METWEDERTVLSGVGKFRVETLRRDYGETASTGLVDLGSREIR